MLTKNSPQFAQHFGAWSMHEPIFNAALDRFRTMDVSAHIAGGVAEPLWESSDAGEQSKRIVADRSDAVAEIMSVDDGIATIQLVGMMTKFGSSFSEMTHGTIAVRRAVRLAAADDAVRAIVLRIDSPGGTVAGTSDLAADVMAADQKKPVVAFIEDMGASAAFQVAVAARHIVANESAVVGSIGVVGAVVDTSESEKSKGRRVIVVRSGPNKGIGIAGAEITDDQVATLQTEVDSLFGLFVAAVATGRNMTMKAVAAIADGRVFIGADAVAVGLVDRIGSLDSVLHSLANGQADGVAATERVQMEPKTKTDDAAVVTTAGPATPQPATLAELKAAIPDSDAEFRETCIESNSTMEQANAKWSDRLRSNVESANQRALDAEARADAAEAATKSAGVDAAGEHATGADAAAGNGSARDEWLAEVKQERDRNGDNRINAVIAANRKNPGLRERMLAEVNG